MKALTVRNTLEKFNDILIEIISISCYNNYRKLRREQNEKQIFENETCSKKNPKGKGTC